MQSGSNISTRRASRRSFLISGVAVGAGAAGVGLLAGSMPAFASSDEGLSHGDAAILRFLSALEILETDLWQQYNEMGGVQDAEVPGGKGSSPYTQKLQVLDMDMPQQAYTLSERAPGLYERRSSPALVMAGHWGLDFEVTPRRGTAFDVIVVDRAGG